MKVINYFYVLVFLLLFPFADTAQANDNDKGINIAMTSAFVSENGIEVYKEISDYISEKLGVNADFVYDIYLFHSNFGLCILQD